MTANNQNPVGWISEASSTKTQLSQDAPNGKARKQFFFEKKNQKTFARCLRAALDNFAWLARVIFNTKNTEFSPVPDHPGSMQRRNRIPAALSCFLCGLCGLRDLRVKVFFSACTEFPPSALLALGLSIAAVHAPLANAENNPFEARVNIEPNGQFTWNHSRVANLLALSALFSANSRRQPKPIVKIWPCPTACPAEIERVEKLAEYYGFDSYVLIVQRVGNPVPLP
jgi:hypothetical protein